MNPLSRDATVKPFAKEREEIMKQVRVFANDWSKLDETKKSEHIEACKQLFNDCYAAGLRLESSDSLTRLQLGVISGRDKTGELTKIFQSLVEKKLT